MLKPKDRTEVIKAVELGMNGRRFVKAVTVTFVFDEDNNLLAKTQTDVQSFFPNDGIARFFSFLEGRRLTG